jgi:hypothetical protein
LCLLILSLVSALTPPWPTSLGDYGLNAVQPLGRGLSCASEPRLLASSQFLGVGPLQPPPSQNSTSAFVLAPFGKISSFSISLDRLWESVSITSSYWATGPSIRAGRDSAVGDGVSMFGVSGDGKLCQFWDSDASFSSEPTPLSYEVKCLKLPMTDRNFPYIAGVGMADGGAGSPVLILGSFYNQSISQNLAILMTPPLATAGGTVVWMVKTEGMWQQGSPVLAGDVFFAVNKAVVGFARATGDLVFTSKRDCPGIAANATGSDFSVPLAARGLVFFAVFADLYAVDPKTNACLRVASAPYLISSNLVAREDPAGPGSLDIVVGMEKAYTGRVRVPLPPTAGGGTWLWTAPVFEDQKLLDWIKPLSAASFWIGWISWSVGGDVVLLQAAGFTTAIAISASTGRRCWAALPNTSVNRMGSNLAGTTLTTQGPAFVVDPTGALRVLDAFGSGSLLKPTITRTALLSNSSSSGSTFFATLLLPDQSDWINMTVHVSLDFAPGRGSLMRSNGSSFAWSARYAPWEGPELAVGLGGIFQWRGFGSLNFSVPVNLTSTFVNISIVASIEGLAGRGPNVSSRITSLFEAPLASILPAVSPKPLPISPLYIVLAVGGSLLAITVVFLLAKRGRHFLSAAEPLLSKSSSP